MEDGEGLYSILHLPSSILVFSSSSASVSASSVPLRSYSISLPHRRHALDVELVDAGHRAGVLLHVDVEDALHFDRALVGAELRARLGFAVDEVLDLRRAGEAALGDRVDQLEFFDRRPGAGWLPHLAVQDDLLAVE